MNLEQSKVSKFELFPEEEEEEEFEGIDICFVIDCTDSMDPFIEASKDTIKLLSEEAKSKAKEFQISEDSLRFSIIAFRDHPEEDNSFVTKVQDFASQKEALEFLENLSAGGGGDLPEAVIDGLYDAAYSINWNTNSEKMCYLIADAPPHGRKYHKFVDLYPDGCPCKKDEEEILTFLRKLKVKFSVIMVKKAVLNMVELFSAFINVELIDISEQTKKTLMGRLMSKPKKIVKNMDDVPGINVDEPEIDVDRMRPGFNRPVFAQRAFAPVEQGYSKANNLFSQPKEVNFSHYSTTQNAMINNINYSCQARLQKRFAKKKYN